MVLLGEYKLPGRLRNILTLGANRAGLVIPDPTIIVNYFHKGSMRNRNTLVELPMIRELMSSMENQSCVQKVSI